MPAEFVTGWVPDDPTLDELDRPAVFLAAGPRVVTHNRDTWDPPKLDQRNVPYCTDYSGVRARQACEFRQTGKAPLPSAMFSAWVTRMRRGEQGAMVGATIRDSAEGAILTGVASDLAHPSDLPGVPLDVRARAKPAPQAFAEAGDHQILKKFVIPDGDVDGIHAALADGYMVHFGMLLGQTFFDTGGNGIVPEWDGLRANAHAMVLVDADQVGGRWGAWGDNSWGTRFGRAGSMWFSDTRLRTCQDIHVYQSVEVI